MQARAPRSLRNGIKRRSVVLVLQYNYFDAVGMHMHDTVDTADTYFLLVKYLTLPAQHYITGINTSLSQRTHR